MTENSAQTEYRSLNDIRLRKEALRKDIEQTDNKIKDLWGTLFSKPDVLDKTASPSKRIASLVSVGASAFDGALLAWKLYHKFKKSNKR